MGRCWFLDFVQVDSERFKCEHGGEFEDKEKGTVEVRLPPCRKRRGLAASECRDS